MINGEYDFTSTSLLVFKSGSSTNELRKNPARRRDIVFRSVFLCPMHNSSFMGKAKLFKQNLYNESLKVSEDYDLFVRLLGEGYSIGNISQPLVLYRQDYYSKRTGFLYFKSDLKIRWLMLNYSHYRLLFPLLIISFIVPVVRLLPVRIFKPLLELRKKIL